MFRDDTSYIFGSIFLFFKDDRNILPNKYANYLVFLANEKEDKYEFNNRNRLKILRRYKLVHLYEMPL